MIEKNNNLQAAGSGLPKYEKFFVQNILLPLCRVFLGWKSSKRWFDYELATIRKMIENLSRDALEKRVLINHFFGIEDDTRDWSIALVIEHITVVNAGIIEVIKTLSKEEAHLSEVSIQAVKPDNRGLTLNHLEKIVKEYESFIPQTRNSKMTKSHPWFTGLNNRDWHTFLAIHTWVHKRQIKAILKQL